MIGPSKIRSILNCFVRPPNRRYKRVFFDLFCRADCDQFKSLSVPLAGDTTLELSSAAVDCPILEDNVLEEFVIQGGTLTVTGLSTTK